MAYIGGGGRGMGIMEFRSPFQLGGYGLGAYSDAEIEAALRSFPNMAVRIENGMNIIDLVHPDRMTGQFPLIGTMDNVPAARQRFDYLEAHKNDTKLPPGTVDENSSDPRTREQNAWLSANAVPGTSMPRPEFRGGLLTPQGQFTRDYSLMTVPAARQSEINAVLQAGSDINKPSGGYVLALNADGYPVSYVGVFPTPEVIAKMQAMGQDISNYSAGMTQGFVSAIATIAKQNPTQTAAVPVPTAPTVQTTPTPAPYVPPAPASTTSVPPVPPATITKIVDEATDQGGNIPQPNGGIEDAIPFIPAGSGGGASTGGGSYMPPPVSGGGGGGGGGGVETAVPIAGVTPVLNAGVGALTDKQKGLLAGAALLGLFVFTRKKGK